jgi:AcrR family transcriptional regulator
MTAAVPAALDAVNPMRTRILEAATSVLARYGLPKVTMEDVARAAGIARQTIYKHFKSKDELVVALFVQEMVDNHHPPLRKVAARTPTAKNLLALFTTELEIGSHFALISGVLDPALAPRIVEITLASEEYTACREALWVPIITRYQDAGVIRSTLDPQRVTRWISYQQFWFITHPEAITADASDRTRYIEDFIIAALLTR